MITLVLLGLLGLAAAFDVRHREVAGGLSSVFGVALVMWLVLAGPLAYQSDSDRVPYTRTEHVVEPDGTAREVTVYCENRKYVVSVWWFWPGTVDTRWTREGATCWEVAS